jgi:large subunit ribosomal protein L15
MPMTRGKGKLKMVSPTAEISIRDLNKLKAEIVTLETLKLEKVIDKRFKKAKVIAGGELTKKVILQGIKATPAAQAAIEAKGGQVT